MHGRFVCGEFACPLSSRRFVALIFNDRDELVAAERFRSERAMVGWCSQVLPAMEARDSAPVVSRPSWVTADGWRVALELLRMSRNVSSGLTVSPGSATVH